MRSTSPVTECRDGGLGGLTGLAPATCASPRTVVWCAARVAQPLSYLRMLGTFGAVRLGVVVALPGCGIGRAIAAFVERDPITQRSLWDEAAHHPRDRRQGYPRRRGWWWLK
ncbi:MAG: hypothetical protein M3Y72_08235 [Acidobacteriota bacterium]|nr:hypothetical protein [Acidobacteriota bacterium]